MRPALNGKIIAAWALAVSLYAAAPAGAQQVGAVFVISMENTNWKQVSNPFTGEHQQIFGNNPAAPFLNQLVNGGSPISKQVAYTVAYHNVMATPKGDGPDIHPSEPNYIWSEAGTNFGVKNDNQPFGNGGNEQPADTLHLTGMLQKSGISWKSYQEDIDLATASGGVNAPGPDSLSNEVAPSSQWTVPLINFSGTSANYTNAYNHTHQYNYAAKHNPMVFFADTSGGNDATAGNALVQHYAPLQQLEKDLSNNTVARYNWITPDLYNDMHTGLHDGFTYNGHTYTASPDSVGAEKIAQGDNFLRQIIPMIVASKAFKDNGVIIIWMDESETDGSGNRNDFDHPIPEIVISPLAHPNVNGLPYASTLNLTHSDDLRTWQDWFKAYNPNGNPYLGDAQNAVGLGDLFAPGAIPNSGAAPAGKLGGAKP